MSIKELTEKLIKEIEQRSNGFQLFIVGVSGLDASGKSQISKILVDQLQNENKNVLSISGDSFQFPREYKENLQEENWAMQHMRRTINFEKMTEELLKPLQSLPKTLLLDVIDYDTKERIQQQITLEYPLIVIVESIYLFQKRVVPYLNYKIFLDITVDEALKRAQLRNRDLELYGGEEGVKQKYNTKNFPGYLEFQKQENPKQYADIVINNNDYMHPVIAKQ